MQKSSPLTAASCQRQAKACGSWAKSPGPHWASHRQRWPLAAAPVWVSVHSQRGFRTSWRFGGQREGTEASKRLNLPAHAPPRKKQNRLARSRSVRRHHCAERHPRSGFGGRAHRLEEDGSARAELEGVLRSSGRRLRVPASLAAQRLGGGGRATEQGMRLHNRSPGPAASRAREPRAGRAAGPRCCRDQRDRAPAGRAGGGARAAAAGGGRRRRGR